jgi:GNAT superfamily N-acetyltransferase
MLFNNLFPQQQYKRPGFLITTDPGLFDLEVIHHFLANDSYWARNIEREKVERRMNYCLCFGVYAIAEEAGAANGQPATPQQIGFARVVTDFTAFAYLADVFILPAYRGRGLGKWLLSCVLAHPEIQGVRWTLYTTDAQGLYTQFGFVAEPDPDRHMVYRPR